MFSHYRLSVDIYSLSSSQAVHLEGFASFKQQPRSMTVEEWSLTDAQRQETVGRVANNISAMAFFRGTPIPDDAVQAASAAVEKKAYTVARVEARTTTGIRCAAAVEGPNGREAPPPLPSMACFCAARAAPTTRP
jgi:hypothetical protein